MAIDRTSIPLGVESTAPSVDWENEFKNSINNLLADAADLTDGDFTSDVLEVKSDAGSGDAGDRHLRFHITNVAKRLLKWVNADNRFKFLDGSSALVPVQVGTPTANDDAATKAYADTAVAGVIPSQTGNSGKFLTTNGSALSWISQSISSMVVLEDQKNTNTAGGGFTSGAWQTRTLNTEVSDPDSICSLSSNQFTLSAGTYFMIARAPALACSRHITRLQNITDAATVLHGSAAYSDSTTSYAVTDSWVIGSFTIAASKALEIQHRCQTTKSTNGFGLESSIGAHETYTQVWLWKIG